MKNHGDEDEYDDRPRKKRRKPKKRGGFPGWLLALLIVLVLAGAGVTIVVLVLQGKDDLVEKDVSAGKGPGTAPRGNIRPCACAWRYSPTS